MRGSFVVAAGILLLVPAARAADGGGGILFSETVPGRGGIVLVQPDGTGLVDLTANEVSYETDTRDYSWSPDGSRIVFSSHRDGSASQEIYVMNADGSAQRRLTFDSGHDSVFNVQPVWSPDGATIAFVHVVGLSHSVWLMGPDGSDVRELVNVGAIVERLAWSPDSTRLLYDVQNAPPTHVEVVDVRSGARRSLTPAGQTDFYASWSPDGRSIAMTSNPFASTSRIDVVDPTDGSRRTVSAVPGTDPAWSPDGREIAFVGVRTFPEYADRYGPPQRLDLYVVSADGTGLRRLTGPLDDDLGREPGAFRPSWWPDGSRLFFHSGEGLNAQASVFAVNADGSCEQRFGPPDVPLIFPAWRPGSVALPATARCADIRLAGHGPGDATGLNTPARLQLKISNDGNLAATGIRLEISVSPKEVVKVDPSVSCVGTAPVVCAVAPIPSQAQITLQVDVSSSTPGLLRTNFAITTDEPDNSPFLNHLELDETVLRCVTVGSKIGDNLVGTNSPDSICGRGGADRIDARAGKDFVDAGSGDDTVIGGPGRDVVISGPGRDVILVRDRRRDTIACGAGRDLVVADGFDRVAADCERVLRR